MMSGLVSYDSSSDEDEVINPIAQAASTAQASTTFNDPPAVSNSSGQYTERDGSRNAEAESTTDGPLLGPAAPTSGERTEAALPVEILVPESMSERDTIRYLTKAPVPMTSMPPSPPGSPNRAANARFDRFLALKDKGVHFNEDLARKSNFLNPGLLATMMIRAGIDEEDQYNTSLSLHLWNPKGFPEWAYKEKLFKSQQEVKDKEDAEKRALSAAGTRTIDFASSGGNSGESSRRSTPGHQKKRIRL